MSEEERRLSADGTVDPSEARITYAEELLSDPSAVSSPARPAEAERERSYTPRSPRPRLFDGETPGTGPQASDVLTEEDYAKMRVMPFGRMMIPAVLGASAIAYFAPILARRMRPPGPENPGKLRTSAFIVSLAGLMGINTYAMLSSSIRDARARALRDSYQRTDDGQIILPDRTAAPAIDRAPTIDAPPSAPAPAPAPGAAELRKMSPEEAEKYRIMAELERLGKAKERTRWAKGKGLAGEVEEEPEMRDTFFRPGTPRKDA